LRPADPTSPVATNTACPCIAACAKRLFSALKKFFDAPQNEKLTVIAEHALSVTASAIASGRGEFEFVGSPMYTRIGAPGAIACA